MRVKRYFGSTSRAWKKFFPTMFRRKTQRASAVAERTEGWNRLPPELVDEILGYLLDDLPSLKACSLTCKAMLGSARPLIGSWLCLAPAQDRKPKGRSIKSLLKPSKGGSDTLNRLIATDRQGLLPYVQHLVLRMGELSPVPQSLQPYIPYFHSINKLQALAIDGLDVSALMPMFDYCLGMFTHSLRSLDIQHIWDLECELLFLISQFPLLEDLSIRFCYTHHPPLGPSPPLLRTSPPFRGHLNLTCIMDSETLFETMAQLPGGIHFTSLELKGCGKPEAIITACQLTLRTICYTWTSFPVAGRLLDLNDNSVLEKFEFRVNLANLPETPDWLSRTLWNINSPEFRELIISISDCSSVTDLRAAVDWGDWKSVDAYFCVLARFQRSFRVVFRLGFEGDEDVVRKSIGECFPLASEKEIVGIELVRHPEVCIAMKMKKIDWWM